MSEYDEDIVSHDDPVPGRRVADQPARPRRADRPRVPVHARTDADGLASRSDVDQLAEATAHTFSPSPVSASTDAASASLAERSTAPTPHVVDIAPVIAAAATPSASADPAPALTLPPPPPIMAAARIPAMGGALGAVDLPDGRFIDRELSWLTFNERVLDLAEDETTPLLERVRFLAIFSSNLDDFFMVRVAGLKRRIATGIAVTAASGLSARDQLTQVSIGVEALVTRQARIFSELIQPQLRAAGIEILRWPDLREQEQASLRQLFHERIYPVLTPLAVDPAHPFPYISGLSLNLGVVVADPSTDVKHFARVKVPPLLDRFARVGDGRYVPIEDVIAAHVHELFPGMTVLETHTFRVTRNEDLEVDEDDSENLLRSMERELLRRRFGPPVRLEVETTVDPTVLATLMRELDVTPAEVYHLPGPLDLSGLFALADIDVPQLTYPRFVPATHPRLREAEEGGPGDFFAAIRAGDILVHHPYDSFSTSVQAFIQQAALDPNVLAIKQTLYRTSGDSPIVDALIEAANAGKQVLVLVEIKARFDEQANIRWARALEEAGCHVVYGLIGLKTHCKLSLVVRDDGDRITRYAHIGTGNYNPKTARIYEDLGLLTADPAIGDDLSALFNHLSGYSRQEDYPTLLVAPHTVRSGVVERIRRVIDAHRAGERASITIKVNSLVDEQVIDALYRASIAGVPIELITRSICALRPGVPGLSESVRVRSIVGRFLEHSRIFHFRAGDDDEYWIGSADMMHRNLDRRVEALVRVTDPTAVAELAAILELSTRDEMRSWRLDAKGTWHRAGTVDYQLETIRRRHLRTQDG